MQPSIFAVRSFIPGTTLVFCPACMCLPARNGLVNQVGFLGLAHAFATVSRSKVQNVLRQTRYKKVRMLETRWTNFTFVREVLHDNYQSRNPIGPYHILGISPRNSTSFTRPFLAGRYMQAGQKTRVVPGIKLLTAKTEGCFNLRWVISVMGPWPNPPPTLTQSRVTAFVYSKF